MDMETGVNGYMVGAVDADTAVNQEALRFAVQRQITCQRSGKLLDERTAVYVRVDNGNAAASEVMAAAAWDEIAAVVIDVCAKGGVKLEIIDGRQVFGANRPTPGQG